MRNKKICTIILASLIATLPLLAQDQLTIKLPAKENFHLFLLAGQSNMAGRGKVAEEDKKINPRVLAQSKDGKWVPAVDPIHYDKGAAGVGPAKSFALIVAEKNPDITIGLVPTACGGSSVSVWEPGKFFNQTKSKPYDDAITRIKLAMKDGTLKAILWHQGESDCNKNAAKYKEKLKALINRFRKELDAPNLPFIIGQLGQFPKRPWNENTKLINEAHISLEKEMPNVYFVSAEGLTCKTDNIHFNAESQREFGKRYAETYLKTLKK